MRLVAIILGEVDSKTRNSEAMALLDYGFNNKKMSILRKKGEVVKKVKLDKGNKNIINIVPKYDVGILEDKNSNNKYSYNIKLKNISLPVKRGDNVGSIIINSKNKKINSVPLVSNTSVNKLNYIELYFEVIKTSILGIIN